MGRFGVLAWVDVQDPWTQPETANLKAPNLPLFPQNLSPTLPLPSEAWEGTGRGPTQDPITLTCLDSQAIPVPKFWEDR